MPESKSKNDILKELSENKSLESIALIYSEFLKQGSSSQIRSLKAKKLEQEQGHREEILRFVKDYIKISSVAVGLIVVATMISRGIYGEDKILIDDWSLRVLVLGTVAQFVSILHLITGRVFKK